MVFRYDSPIQNWMRQPAENSVRWIVPLDTMSNVGEMISFHFVTLSIKLNPYKAPFLANIAKITTRYNAHERPFFKRLDR